MFQDGVTRIGKADLERAEFLKTGILGIAVVQLRDPMPAAKREGQAKTGGRLLRVVPLLLLCYGILTSLLFVKELEAGITAKVPFVLFNGTVLCLLLLMPYADLITKIEIRRFCKRHRLKLVTIHVTKRTYGVDYIHENEKKYGRWPDDFEKDRSG